MNVVLRVYNKKTREALVLPSSESNCNDYDFRIVSTEKYVLYLRKEDNADDRVHEKTWGRKAANNLCFSAPPRMGEDGELKR